MDIAGVFHAQMRFTFRNVATVKEPTRTKNRKVPLRIIPDCHHQCKGNKNPIRYQSLKQQEVNSCLVCVFLCTLSKGLRTNPIPLRTVTHTGSKVICMRAICVTLGLLIHISI